MDFSEIPQVVAAFQGIHEPLSHQVNNHLPCTPSKGHPGYSGILRQGGYFNVFLWQFGRFALELVRGCAWMQAEFLVSAFFARR